MKKSVFLVLLIAVGTITAFGGEFYLSAGAGCLSGAFFTRYTLSASGVVQAAPIKIEASQETNQVNYGFFAFIDATYALLSVFYQNGLYTYTETADISAFSNNILQSGKGRESVVGISLLGKYPFTINERLIVFPLLGMDYQISLIQKRTQPDGFMYNRTDGLREQDKDGNAYRLDDWNSLWVNIGGGLDYILTGNFFLRGELLYGFRLMTPYETKNLDLMKSQANDPKPKLGGLTSGPSLRLCAGYCFL